ncbi:AAA domain-containing protein [Burkholderia oklahomensis]|uniref:Viral (Super1) RNA helicase family protein n=1 Tax=Burkholderia oklahomensis TaxID=342113 RepID=A0AAI8FPX6_9BURK|nr:AAA domain-containing protein [Burkholderia oklahomensis]AIO68599.1 viral (Super1) RNA helicase family protein [Burkholderia oklahomensis]AOI38426.1 DNA helicase [Burkholderia oklahomensis EO147]KUY48452.1 DNA helicase [Burkholderia oklahomensis EO147]QPS41230.1 AAA family ATPase [Burkholderia oklahomensis]
MHDKSRAYAAYWRNSLVDAELGKGTLKRDELGAHRKVSETEAQAGFLHEDTVTAFFSGEEDDTRFVEVVYRPLLYRAKVEHGRIAEQLPELIAPIVTQALLSRDGCLLPKSDTIVPRDILQPLEAGAFSIGTVDDLDTFLTKEGSAPSMSPSDVIDDSGTRLDEFAKRWAAYLAGVRRMTDAVCGAFVSRTQQFMLVDHALVLKKNVITGATRHIVPLYDHLRDKRPESPLFDTYAREAAAEIEPCLSLDASFADRLGHSSDRFALVDAQRAALNHVLAAQEGEIVAVNGPPGTGKTTLLLSVVASLWARAALEGGDPPVVCAASTNNQAVTNIIDAFGKDFSHGDGALGGRWLPGVASFGTYLPSQQRETESAGKYQTNAFFDAIETTEYVDQARTAYLSHAQTAFPGMKAPTVAAVVARLQDELKTLAGRLAAVEGNWHLLRDAEDEVANELGGDASNEMMRRRNDAADKGARARRWKTIKDEWESYRARESLFYAFFSWLSPVAGKRIRLAREHLKKALRDESFAPESLGATMPEIEAAIGERFQEHARSRDAAALSVERGESVLLALSDARDDFRTAAREAGLEVDGETLTLAQCDLIADTQLRFRIFLLTTHYWEGRWLLEMAQWMPAILKTKERRNPGPSTLMSRFRRRMMVTPCMVSTFAMLPKHLRTFVAGDGGFRGEYLYNFIDLLIVDEAGQVLPEVAGASFALARKALVIGDTQQIEPIWSIPRQVDFGNLANLGLVTGESETAQYEKIAETGKAAASGSVMRAAQNASRYHADPELERGLYLYEHRRCYDEIIAFCNTLCYRGKLLPRRGPAPVREAHAPDCLPPMAYLHIDGICESLPTGSRRNLLEAETIAAWLAANRAMLEAQYQAPLARIVGIVSPFAAQVAAIQAACEKLGIEVGRADGQLTGGTVHSLQGAERHVVIFSPVYSKHDDGRFIDRSVSMLNVAVSRAKDSFLVFGDMDVFTTAAPSEPRGILAKFLFSHPDNALSFEHRPRTDLQTRDTAVSQLRDAAGHDAFLLDTLSRVKACIQIVTPWLRLDRAKEVGAFEAMCEAVERGVDVEIYTDPQLNIGDAGPEAGRKRERLLADAEAFREAGIAVTFVRRVHSKIVIGDEEIYCVGSFNWLSAVRSGAYARHETSLLYRGSGLLNEILSMRKSLLQRTVTAGPFASEGRPASRRPSEQT